MSKYFIKKSVIATSLLLSIVANAKTINLSQGSTDTVITKKKIDTIFISNPGVADYQILDDNRFLIYGKTNGETEVIVYDASGKVILKDLVRVNSAISDLKKINNPSQLEGLQIPNTDIRLKKVGSTYVLEGNAKTQTELDEVLRLVGSSLGDAGESVSSASVPAGGGGSAFNKYEYGKIINNVKVEQVPQINVKLTVAEVSRDFSESIGIEWSKAGEALNTNLSPSHISYTGGGLKIGFNAGSLAGFINALSSGSNGRVLSSPNVSMLSGESASILVGGELPFIQKGQQGGAPSVSFKEYGVRLNVAAKVQKDGRIRVALDQSVSSIAGNREYQGIGEVPYFSTRTSQSVFEVRNGESFILGGLYSTSDIVGSNSIPILGKLPLIGAFFRSDNTNRAEKELVIVATVNTIEPTADPVSSFIPKGTLSGTLERFFVLDSGFKDPKYSEVIQKFILDAGFIK